ncbi:MAG: hypothetical protein OXR66_08705 [Candidatus Woesearchaeota archaeon]|nr:hypothetical protein [Candidatus Woesearchaeota archaeon]
MRRIELILLLIWVLFCFLLTYKQVWDYAMLFFTHYGPTYFPFLEAYL